MATKRGTTKRGTTVICTAKISVQFLYIYFKTSNIYLRLFFGTVSKQLYLHDYRISFVVLNVTRVTELLGFNDTV